MQFQKQSGGTQVEVLKVVPDGAIHRWNGGLGNKPVLRGDRIVAINGNSEFKAIHQELASMTVSLRLERWVDSGTAGGTTTFSAAPLTGGAAMLAPTPAVAATLPRAGGNSHGVMSVVPWRGALIVMLLSLVVLGDRPTIEKLFSQGHAQLAGLSRMFVKSVKPEWRVNFAMVMLFVGLIFGVCFLRNEIRMVEQPCTRQTVPQIFVALIASVSLGYGNLFLLTWAGVYA